MNLPPTEARLLAPRPSLASCIRAVVVRNTVGAPLTPSQRINRYAASPWCSITWHIHGTGVLLEPPLGQMEPWNPILYGGPQTRPTITANPGAAHFVVVLFYPEAFQALTGIDMAATVDGWFTLDMLVDADWQAMAQQVQCASDDAARIRLLEDFLEPRWLAARPETVAGNARDWLRSMAVRAAGSDWSRSVRSAERRIKSWAGQSMRALRRLDRIEQSYVDARKALDEGTVSWAEVAAQGGFSDQAHLVREVRDLTGLTPAQLARARREDESFWMYRIWA
jgi:AraC-like DNA-binding protein